jgi:hypothetical protein
VHATATPAFRATLTPPVLDGTADPDGMGTGEGGALTEERDLPREVNAGGTSAARGESGRCAWGARPVACFCVEFPQSTRSGTLAGTKAGAIAAPGPFAGAPLGEGGAAAAGAGTDGPSNPNATELR